MSILKFFWDAWATKRPEPQRQTSELPATGGNTASVGVGFIPDIATLAQQTQALTAEVDLGYGLVFVGVRAGVLIFKTAMADRLSADEWSIVAQIVSHKICTSLNPNVRTFLSSHAGSGRKIRQIVIAKSA